MITDIVKPAAILFSVKGGMIGLNLSASIGLFKVATFWLLFVILAVNNTKVNLKSN